MGIKKSLGLLRDLNYFELSEVGASGLSSSNINLSGTVNHRKALINKIKKFYHVKYKHRTKSKAP